jgi:hypothetical protein
MIKDIPENIVEDIAVAVVKEKNQEDEYEWNAYIVNLKKEMIEGVLITATGYGIMNEEEIKTTTLRYLIEEVPPLSFAKIEPVMEDVFGINNEYWVSFYVNSKMYDKKYVFLAESIREENFTLVPLLHKKGVMIR